MTTLWRMADRWRVRHLWEQGLDTIEIAKDLQVPEYVAESILHEALDIKAEVRSDLRASVEVVK
jgi:uncharacterized membrane protein